MEGGKPRSAQAVANPSLVGTAVTAAGHLDGKAVSPESPGGVGGCGDLDAGIRQTLDLATGEAGKMGMEIGRAGGRVAEFKPPDMRAMIGADQEAGVRQVDEIPIEGGPVQARGC